jgi:hypothetical protein
MKHFYMFCALTFFVFSTSAQSTYQSVYSLFQANCTIGCHGNGGNSGNLDLYGGGSATTVYNNIVNVDPVNPAALAKGHKRIMPGYPERSFLLRKCATSSWDAAYSLDLTEGANMPDNQPSLEKEEVELIRQWIQYGAPQSGQVVSTQTLYDYYHVNGSPRVSVPQAPAPDEGFQLHIGPIFLNPGEEIEFYKKEGVFNSTAFEVNELSCNINDDSHHFLLFGFIPGAEDEIDEGLRLVNLTSVFPEQTKYVVGWVDTDTTNLPDGTAYYVHQNAYLDLNYHTINYSPDSILAAEAYTNIYTQPLGTADKEMKSELVLYSPLSLVILNNGEEQTFTGTRFDAGSEDSWNIWFLSTHTHKYGTAYNVYKRNANGSKGDILYDGNYNTSYTFNQGYYDWAHPANRYFDPLETIDASNGILHEAKFKISDPNEPAFVITFGLTTSDEMMLVFMQYTVTEPLGVADVLTAADNISAYPNPVTDILNFSYNLKEESTVAIDIYDISGKLIANLMNKTETPGKKFAQINTNAPGWTSGTYYVRLSVNGESVSKQIVKID